MKRIKSDIVFILLLYTNLIYVGRLTAACYLIEGFNFIYLSFLIASGAAVFLVYKHILSKNSYRIRVTLGFILLIALYCYIKNQKVIELMNEIYTNFNEISKQVFNAGITYFYQYKLILDIAVPLGVLVLLIATCAGFYDVTLFAVFIFMVVLWHVGYTSIVKQRLICYVFISTVTFTISSYMKTLKSLEKRGINTFVRSGEFFIYSIICSLIIAIIISILPHTSPGKYSSAIKNKIQTGINGKEATNNVNSMEYGLVLSGYGDSSSKLGGPVSIDDTLALKVKADRPLYLRGSAKNFYDGFTWTKKNTRMLKKERSELPPIQTAHMFNLSDTLSEVAISPVNLKTSSVLVPEYVFNLDIEGNDIYYDKDLTYEAKKNITDRYNVIYTPYKESYGVISNSVNGKEYRDLDNEYAYCLQRNPDIMSKYGDYLQLPDNIPKRVYELVDKITSGCRTNGEKVESIYIYLRNTYKYSLNVSDIPKDQEFVDYFLFTEKKGYCTYFATAATIMCRIAGVPARYVEGFNMPKMTGNEGLFLVTNKNAHAWTEILIGPETDLWSILDCVPDAEELMTREINEKDKGKSVIDTSKGLSIKDKMSRNKEDTDNNLSLRQSYIQLSKWQKVLLVVLSGTSIYLLVVLAFMVYRWYSITKSSSIIPLYLYYLSKLKSMGHSRPENLGDMEFAYTIEDRNLRDRVIKLVKSAYAEHFGGRKTNDVDKKEYYRFIKRYSKKEKRKFR
jgi:hypothetical protein